MKQKLIKLSESHYIIVDDSEKITHSTQPLEGKATNWEFGWDKIEPLSLLEVEEAVNGYQLNKDNLKVITHSTEPLENEVGNDGFMFDANSTYPKNNVKIIPLLEIEEAVNGYQLNNLAKDKLLVTDKNLLDFLYLSRTQSQYTDKAIITEFKQSLISKTE